MGQAGRVTPSIDNADFQAYRAREVLDDRAGFSEVVKPVVPSPWTRWAAFVAVALLGLLIRLPRLGERPMHTDEAVNAYIIGQMLAGQPFKYDPRDRHGPMLAALAVPLARMQGAKAFSDLTEEELRLAPVLAGTATILLFGTAVEMLGFVPCLIAALLFAVAPLPVYYDRYFIHESIFVCATFVLILTARRAWQNPSAGRVALAAVCAALMLATKETAVLHFFALAGAAFVYWRWNLRGRRIGNWFRPGVALAGMGAFLLTSVVLFTWFGSNWKALAGLSQALPNSLARAAGEGHQAPFWYYAKLLAGGWSGGMISIAACIGLILAARRRTPSPYGFLAFYALLITLTYSLIPYKTPWLALNFWLMIALFAGRAAELLWLMSTQHRGLRNAIRSACILSGVLGAFLIAHDTRLRVFVHPADESNLYAYAHTSEDLLGLPAEIKRLARQNAIVTPRIAVIASDPWPLPWYLRRIAEVGYWQPGQQPAEADFYITSTEAANQYEEQLKDFRPQFFGVRPGVLVLLWSPAPK